MNPFQKKYFNIALREYEQHIDALKAENTKKQRRINDLENNIEKQKQKTANLKNKCFNATVDWREKNLLFVIPSSNTENMASCKQSLSLLQLGLRSRSWNGKGSCQMH